MSWTKVLIINIIMLLLLLCVEIFGRLMWTARSCVFDNGCDFSRIKNLKIRNMQSGDIKLSIFDPELGYLPTPGFNKEITLEGWDNSRVTINPDGFRSNGNGISGSYQILTVGDSFTFGDQVSNNQTWPSCLENIFKKSGQCGVFGYGAASLLKGHK